MCVERQGRILTGARKKKMLSGSKNQDVKIFCEIKHFSGLLWSPEQMGPRDQEPGGSRGCRLVAPGSSQVLVLFKDHSKISILRSSFYLSDF